MSPQRRRRFSKFRSRIRKSFRAARRWKLSFRVRKRSSAFRVQHVVECERILSNLLEKTPETHRDYNELSKVAARFKQMVKGREEELHEAENECKLYGIQDRFPSDNLYLSEKQNSHRSKAPPRRRSVSATVIKAALGSRTHSTKSSTVDGSMRMKTAEPNFPLSSELIPARIFIKEGPVVLQSSSMPSQDRYLVLFDDILLVAKLRSATSLKLKHRVRVSEIWLAGCVDHVCDSVRAQDNSFVIGWPTTNFVVSFNTAEEKEAWYTALAKQIKEKKELEDPKSVSLKVYNRDMVSSHSCGYNKSFSVSNMDDAASVVKMSQAIFNIQTDDPSDYQLWVVSGKVGDAYPLIGHEFPFAIKMNHMREAAMADDDGFHFPLDYEQQLPAMDPLSPETQCQFILKRNEKMTNRIPIDVQNAPSRQRWRNPIRRSQIMNWAQRRTGSSKSNTIDVQSLGKLFGLPLNQLCSDEEVVPKAVMELLLHLFRYGPNTTGIFRKSANAKTAREVKLELDEGKVVDFEGISEIVAASLMKEFLRSLPDCIFESENYEDLVATNTLQDREERVRQIKGILDGINAHNYELLKRFMCVLYHIADNAEINNMNAYNLAVCISPSMLWAPNSSNIPPTEQSNVVPPVIQFLIEHCVEIMGDSVKTVLGDRSEIAVNHVTSDSESGIQDSRTALSQSSTDDGIESPEPLSPKGERTSIHSSDSNLYVPSTLAVSPPKKSASSPNSPCDSGIPSPSSSPTVKRHVELSDQLNAAFCEPGERKGQSTACRRNSEPLGSPPDSLKLRLKGSRKFPNCKRQLSSTTTSAELIEHKQTSKTTASGRKLETAVLRRAHSPQTVRLFPVTQYQRLNPIPVSQGSLSRALEVKPGPLPRGSSCDTHEGNVASQVLPSSPVSKQTPGAPRSSSPSPDQVFQAVDRRRQPAAPSYQEHMQRRRELVSRPALFAGSEGKEMIDSEREQESPREKKELDEHGEHVQQVLLSSKAAALGERLDSERSETSSGPRSPLSPTSQPEYVWEQVDDSSSSSVGVSSGLRKLEHSPFGLNLHHKRQASEGSYEKPNTENSKKPLSLPPCSNTGHLRVCPTSVSITITNSVAQNSSLTHFPSSEIFPHEAQTKTHWSPSVDTRVTSAIPISNSHGALRLRAGSTTSSSSSVSSLDEQSSICHDSTPPESKTDVTQIRDIKELLCQTKHANGLKISPQTAQAIAKVRTPRSKSGPYPVPSHHDMEKILSTEESYV
ncbi:uncharacterized protein LOC114977474 isoform X3 [Acropora millepora]|uniref:uncharacterized protein LOC114977474 isoform X3 n=1 Tax=Acropora millepora TaxID=45264 RepID=UPI001CF5ECCD|nr:uncharacterized protein LOC114977474 isoform X3 [Acropora millepora]